MQGIGSWFRVSVSSAFGTAVSLAIYFGLPMDWPYNAVIGLIVGILAGCFTLSFKLTAHYLGRAWHISAKTVKEESTVSSVSNDEVSFNGITVIKEIGKRLFQALGRLLKFFFTFKILKFAFGFSYRLVLMIIFGRYSYQYFMERMAVSGALGHACFWALYAVSILMFLNLLVMIVGQLESPQFCLDYIDDYNDCGFFWTEGHIYADAAKLAIQILILFAGFSVGVICLVFTLCLTPFYVMLELKKNAKLWLVATGVIIGSMAGWLSAGQGVYPAVIIGIGVALFWVGLPFLLNLFISEVKPGLPFKVFDLVH